MSRQSVIKKTILAVAMAAGSCVVAQAKPLKPIIPGVVYVGPYLYQQTQFDGSELLVNTASIREASRLLAQQKRVDKNLAKKGMPAAPVPRLQLSGYVEAQAGWSSKNISATRSQVNLSGAELDVLAHASKYAMGFMAIDYNNTPISGTATNNTFHLSRGFFVLGNFSSQSSLQPLYLTAGQFYMPFGRYSSAMVSDPYTKVLGRTLARGIELGYTQQSTNSFHAEVYGFQGENGGTGDFNRFGVDAGYNFAVNDWSGRVGGSWISNLAESQGIVGLTAAPVAGSSTKSFEKVTGGIDGYGLLSYTTNQMGSVTLISEYVTALGKLKGGIGSTTAGMNNQRPGALDVQLTYALPQHVSVKPVAFTLDYGHSSHASDFTKDNVGKNRFGGTVSTSLLKNTALALEYMHTRFYDNKSGSQVTGQFDVYF